MKKKMDVFIYLIDLTVNYVVLIMILSELSLMVCMKNTINNILLNTMIFLKLIMFDFIYFLLKGSDFW